MHRWLDICPATLYYVHSKTCAFSAKLRKLFWKYTSRVSVAACPIGNAVRNVIWSVDVSSSIRFLSYNEIPPRLAASLLQLSMAGSKVIRIIWQKVGNTREEASCYLTYISSSSWRRFTWNFLKRHCDSIVVARADIGKSMATPPTLVYPHEKINKTNFNFETWYLQEAYLLLPNYPRTYPGFFTKLSLSPFSS